MTKPKAPGRRQSRRTALFLLYQWDLTGQPLASLYEGTPDEFAADLASAVAERAERLDERITEASEGWSADRLGTLERNILRVGVYELEEGTVPPEVAINEAVVLAKRYATDEAAGLVNGILGHIQRGGTPSSYDRLLATRMGAHAVEAFLAGEKSVLVGVSADRMITTPLSEALKKPKRVDPNGEIVRMARDIGMSFGD